MQNLTLYISLVLILSATTLAETYRYTPDQAHLLADAFQRLQSGDRVVFERGTYRLESGLELTDLTDVTLESRGQVTLLVNDLDDSVLEINNCRNVTVKGLRAAHREPGKEYQCEGPVIEVRKSKQVLIAENRLNGCGAAGVHAYQSQDVVVLDNRIFNNTYAAIWVTDSQVFVHRNKIHDNAATLSTYGKCDVTLTENSIQDNSGNDYVQTDFFRRAVGDREN